MLRRAHSAVQRLVHIVHRMGVCRLHSSVRFRCVIDLESNVVYAAVLHVKVAADNITLELQDCDIHIAVAEVVPIRIGACNLAHLFKSKNFLVELRGLVGLLR